MNIIQNNTYECENLPMVICLVISLHPERQSSQYFFPRISIYPPYQPSPYVSLHVKV